MPNIVLNTAVAKVLSEMADRLEGAEDFAAEVAAVIKDTLTAHKRIIFNGNGYSEEWIAEAEQRGLPNLVSTVDCVPLYTKDEYVSLFERFKVYSRVEIESRTEILLENYTKVITIEALTMLDMVRKQILPAAVRYNKEICDAALSKKTLGLDSTLELQMASKLSALTAEIAASTQLLDEKLAAAVDKVFDLRPAGIIEMLKLRRPQYRKLAAYGHFGREDLNVVWEKTDKVDAIKAALAE
jgi:glutamine synthetase